MRHHKLTGNFPTERPPDAKNDDPGSPTTISIADKRVVNTSETVDQKLRQRLYQVQTLPGRRGRSFWRRYLKGYHRKKLWLATRSFPLGHGLDDGLTVTVSDRFVRRAELETCPCRPSDGRTIPRPPDSRLPDGPRSPRTSAVFARPALCSARHPLCPRRSPSPPRSAPPTSAGLPRTQLPLAAPCLSFREGDVQRRPPPLWP